MRWLAARMNGDEGDWKGLPDRVEIAWGPDHRNRCDLYLFEGGGRGDYFSEIPRGFRLPIEDKRDEVAAFVDAEPGNDQVVTAGGY